MILSDVCELIVDCPHSTAKDEGEGYPLVRTPNIGKGRLLLEGVHRVSQEVYDKRNFRAVPQKNDLIFAREAPAGNVAIIKDEKVCLGQRTVLIRPNADMINPDFLVYFLLSPKQQYGLLGTANGATVAHVNIPTIRNLPIEIPDISIQNKIADILSTYDDLVENNQKQIKLLEEAAQRLYKEWFVDLRFPGYENTPIFDGIPQGWKVDAVKSVVSLLSGYAFKSGDFVDSGQYKIVTIKNVQDGNFDGKNVNTIAEIPSKMPSHCNLNDGDILLSLTGNVGRACLVNGEDYLLNQRVAKLDSKYPAYAYCLFRNKDMFDIMNNLANGAAQQNLSPIRTENVRILIPSDNLIEKFENVVSPMISKMLVLNKANSNLKQARDRLLPKLMSGEIEV